MSVCMNVCKLLSESVTLRDISDLETRRGYFQKGLFCTNNSSITAQLKLSFNKSFEILFQLSLGIILYVYCIVYTLYTEGYIIKYLNDLCTNLN